jgi:hypothetical protein
MRVRQDPPWTARGRRISLGLVCCALASLTACGNDEDVGGSGDSQTTKPPDATTSSTTETPTSSTGETDPMPTTGEPDPTTGEPDPTTTGPDPDPLTVDCGTPPNGAAAAKYSHQPTADGGSPAYTWSANNLPDGLTIDPDTGAITGAPTTPGDYVFELVVMDSDGMSAKTECPSVNINDQLGVDLEAMPGPCITGEESLLDYVFGGDGTPIECIAPKGVGDGTLPAGITIDKQACTITGAITETRYGTFAWIVRGRQSGVDVFVPYCATQDKQAPNAYDIIGSHSGMLDNELEPIELTVNPADPLRFDGDADPAFVIDKGACGASCFFGFLYQVSPTPFGTGECAGDKDKCFGLCPLVADANEPDGDKQIGCSLVPAMGPKTGFAHELWAKGDVPPAEFQTRPFILQWLIDYCVSNVMGECTGKDAILANGDGSNLAFPVIVRPQG